MKKILTKAKDTGLEFKPDLTPMQMIRLGVFGNNYFVISRKLLIKEFPDTWKVLIRKKAKDSNYQYTKDTNLFKVESGLSLEEWQSKGWINDQDPLGWFQWYCRYYLGRRTTDDERQIKRYKAFIRHSKACASQSKGDLSKQTVRRQALLHWAWDPFPDAKLLPGETTFKKCKRLAKVIAKNKL